MEDQSRKLRADFCLKQANRFVVFAGTGLETPELDERVSLDTPWNVVVHNDPVNLMSYVTRVLQKVFGFERARAEKHMMEVHKTGRSIVWTGTKEKSELYVQQLQGFLLLTTLERTL